MLNPEYSRPSNPRAGCFSYFVACTAGELTSFSSQRAANSGLSRLSSWTNSRTSEPVLALSARNAPTTKRATLSQSVWMALICGLQKFAGLYFVAPVPFSFHMDRERHWLQDSRQQYPRASSDHRGAEYKRVEHTLYARSDAFIGLRANRRRMSKLQKEQMFTLPLRSTSRRRRYDRELLQKALRRDPARATYTMWC